MAKQYKYYACCKDASGNGVTCAGRDIMEEAYKDLEELKRHADMIFVGVIKCAGNPLGHICHLNVKE
jgi:hypothetical protein